jgi:hypothetical protein
LIAFCCSVQAQSNTDPATWIQINKGLLEVQKNFKTFYGANPDFEKRLATLIEDINAFITAESTKRVLQFF